MPSSAQHLVLTVLLPDRVGILRDVTAVIVAAEGNIDGISQTIVSGFFCLTLTVAVPAAVLADQLRAQLEALLGSEAAVVVRSYRKAPRPAVPHGSRYIAMTRGPDRPGTIHAISDFFVGHGINIEDWQLETEQDDVVYMAQVTLPPGADAGSIQTDFRSRMAGRGLAAALAHENIFRATNEIGPIRTLIGAGPEPRH